MVGRQLCSNIALIGRADPANYNVTYVRYVTGLQGDFGKPFGSLVKKRLSKLD